MESGTEEKGEQVLPRAENFLLAAMIRGIVAVNE